MVIIQKTIKRRITDNHTHNKSVSNSYTDSNKTNNEIYNNSNNTISRTINDVKKTMIIITMIPMIILIAHSRNHLFKILYSYDIPKRLYFVLQGIAK